MANVLGTLFGDIAKEIRAKTGETGTMKPAEFPEKISEIEVKADPVLQALEVTENGTYTPSSGVDGYSPVTVNVPDIPAVVQALEVTENGAYTPPEGVDGFSSVNVNVPAPEIVLQDKTVTENGTYTADEGFDGLGTVTVEVAGSGSSLPAGAYWEQKRNPYFTSQAQFILSFQGNYYVWAKINSSDTRYSLYKWDNGDYTKLVDSFIDRGPNYMGLVEFNGKLHMLGGETTMHYTFDGEAITKLSSLPSTSVEHCGFVLNDTLYIKTKSSGFYKWIEDTDTWEAVEITGYPTSYESVHVYNGTVYIFGYSKLYKVDWDNQLCEIIANNLINAPNGFNIGRYLYLNYNTDLFKYDFETGEYLRVGYTPVSYSLLQLYNADGKLGLWGFNNNTKMLNLVLHEVTE